MVAEEVVRDVGDKVGQREIRDGHVERIGKKVSFALKGD